MIQQVKISKFVLPLLLWVVLIFPVLLYFMVMPGCAPAHFTPTEKVLYTSTKTLVAAKNFRDTGLSITGGLYKQGLLSEELKIAIIEVGNQLQDAINKTSEALEIYKLSDGSSGGADLQTKIVLYQALYGKFSELVMPYVLKNMGGS